METTIVYWGYIGKMEKEIESTIIGLYSECLYCTTTSHSSGRLT